MHTQVLDLRQYYKRPLDLKYVGVRGFYKIIWRLIQVCEFVVLYYGDSDILLRYNNEVALTEEGRMAM